MSRSPREQASAKQNAENSAALERMADELIALVEEFEAALNHGHVPPALASRLAKILQDAEGLMAE